MKIGIIGAGHIGATLAGLFVKAGHEVTVSNSRGPDTLADLVAELGPNAHAGTVEDAARFGDLVVVAIPLKDYGSVPAGAVAGKVVIDTMNYYASRDGQIEELDSGALSSSELLARHLPDASVVKAFNTIRWDHLRDKATHIGIPISGDDAAAKQTVTELVAGIGFDAVDAGPLGEGGRKHQPGTAVYGAELSSEELAGQLGT